MNEKNDWEELIDRHLHGELDEAEKERLAELLDSNAADAGSARNVLVDQFGARLDDGRWDFSNAKTLVLYCNGMWCSQSTAAIESLLHFGYPAEKLKWYRGGMQDWENLGLTTVKLDE